MGMLSPGLFYPINWWGSASQGGRIMGRFLMMYEDGDLTARLQMKFILLQKFLDKYSGPFNTALLYTRSALMESFAYYVLTTTTKYGRVRGRLAPSNAPTRVPIAAPCGSARSARVSAASSICSSVRSATAAAAQCINQTWPNIC